MVSGAYNKIEVARSELERRFIKDFVEDIPRMTHSLKGDEAHPRHNVADES